MIDAIISWVAAHPYDLAWMLACVAIPLLLFQMLPLLVLMERRGAGYIQDRTGPNRASVNLSAASLSRLAVLDPRGLLNSDGKSGGLRLRAFGMLFNIADLLKLIGKEEFTPPFVFKGFYLVAPAIPVITGLLTPALIPFWAPIPHVAGTMAGSLIDSSSGLLLLFAIGSLSVYGIVLGSWSSNSKYSLLGGMRAAAMMISYEVSMGLAILGMLLLVGSFNLNEVVIWQGTHAWGILVQPLGFALFLVAMFAETNRNPFDVAEGESEIVAGFHTEYNGMKFMLFMTAEYLHIIGASLLLATLFLGGWQLAPFPLPLHGLDAPFVVLDGVWLRDHLGLAAAIMLGVTALPLLGFAWLIGTRRTAMLRRTATDREVRAAEYRFYQIAALGAAAACVIGAAVCSTFDPEPVAVMSGVPQFSGLVNALAAVVQLHIVLGKALLFCWLFVWVRWTLPRFRYDQIMGLGWKVLLNLALVNLLVTAIVAKLLGMG